MNNCTNCEYANRSNKLFPCSTCKPGYKNWTPISKFPVGEISMPVDCYGCGLTYHEDDWEQHRYCVTVEEDTRLIEPGNKGIRRLP